MCGKNFENLMHLGEYARIIAFGDEILRCKISHHISRYATASPQGEGYDLCRSVKLRNKSKCIRVTVVRLPSPSLRDTSPKGRGKGVCRTGKQSDKSEFVPQRTILCGTTLLIQMVQVSIAK